MHSEVEPEPHLEATLLNINVLNGFSYFASLLCARLTDKRRAVGSKRANGELRAVSDGNQGFSGGIRLGSSLAGRYQ